MALDPYQQCLCGSETKLKFCCCKDILHDLERVVRLLEADQRRAAIEEVDRLVARHGERAALLLIKAGDYLRNEDYANAAAAVQAFLAKNPANPTVLAQKAMVQACTEDVIAAVADLQKALGSIGDPMPVVVYQAIDIVAQALLAQGEILAAIGHLLLQVSITGDSNRAPLSMVMQILSSPEVPMLLKQEPTYATCPRGAAWARQFYEAMTACQRGAWQIAADKLNALAQRNPQEPSIWKNLAILHGWLADLEKTVAAWRRYSQLPSIALDDAVEAEARAQLLDPEAYEATLDILSITYPVHNAQALMERLLSDPRASQMPVDPRRLAAEGQPPPKGVFWLLDRPLPKTGVGLTRDAAPVVVGEMYLFGRQTDREARLEFTTTRTRDFAEKTAVLADLLGDLSGAAQSEKVIRQISATGAALTWNWRLPDDTPAPRRAELVNQERENVILNKWPELPLSVLDGKSPSQAASDPAYRVRLLAAILLLELSSEREQHELDFNRLRSKLGLPTRDPIDAASVDAGTLPPWRLALLQADQLSDDALLTGYHRAVQFCAVKALRKLAPEVLRREGLAKQVGMSEVYESLSAVATDSDKALDYLIKAREAAVANGNSPAHYLVSELSMRLQRGDAAEARRLIEQIRNQHMREPGIAQAFYEVLVRFGIIAPDGTPAGAQPGTRAASGTAPAAAPEAAKKVWTPDSGTKPPAGEGKSKLWLPGMD